MAERILVLAVPSGTPSAAAISWAVIPYTPAITTARATVRYRVGSGPFGPANLSVGFASGEWRGITGTPRHQMYLAIGVLIAAAMVMAYGNTLTKI